MFNLIISENEKISDNIEETSTRLEKTQRRTFKALNNNIYWGFDLIISDIEEISEKLGNIEETLSKLEETQRQTEALKEISAKLGNVSRLGISQKLNMLDKQTRQRRQAARIKPLVRDMIVLRGIL